MKNYFVVACLAFIFMACKRDFEAPVPARDWPEFDNAAAGSLPAFSRGKMEGVYQFLSGADVFGADAAVNADAAVKWSYVINDGDSTWHLSFFLEREAAYFICEAKVLDNRILLNGYWRKMANTSTGRLRLTINSENGAEHLLMNTPRQPNDSIIISGVFGYGEEVPTIPLQLKFVRPLYNATPLEIVAHRGGGSTADLLPASENSVPMIRMASQFGATGIEIDVRLTSDGVPILFHDATLNERLIQKNGLLGPIENYSYAQLSTLVLLRKGERIPTLQEALETVVYETPLKYVWLDTKFEGPIQLLRNIQKAYLQKAAAAGRQLNITIGIPDEQVLNQFLKLPDFATTPSVCELSPEDVEKTNASIWAPRWTLGLQKEAVERVHNEGRKVYVWTLDGAENIKEYMYNGDFDGILSNYPSLVAYYYYAKP
jgi:glycerophosphoryl diester phosphodiesterase